MLYLFFKNNSGSWEYIEYNGEGFLPYSFIVWLPSSEVALTEQIRLNSRV